MSLKLMVGTHDFPRYDRALEKRIRRFRDKRFVRYIFMPKTLKGGFHAGNTNRMYSPGQADAQRWRKMSMVQLPSLCQTIFRILLNIERSLGP